MRDDDNGRAFCLGGLDQTIEDLQRRVSIEIAGGFVGENAGRIRHHGACNCGALSFAARELTGQMSEAL